MAQIMISYRVGEAGSTAKGGDGFVPKLEVLPLPTNGHCWLHTAHPTDVCSGHTAMTSLLLPTSQVVGQTKGLHLARF